MSGALDVFVSYAHVDNDILPGADSGWVSTFIDALKFHLNRKIGRKEKYSLWMDYELRGNTPLTEDILQNLTESKTILVFLSPAYLSSAWCLKELETFIALHGVSTNRIFIVEQTHIENKPSNLSDLTGYKFWYRDSSEKARTLGIPKPRADEIAYYQNVEDVATDMVQVILGRDRRVVDIPTNNGASIAENPSVFVSPVADDLYDKRAEIVRFLEQHNVTVFPTSNSILHDVDSELEQCSLFVQLLDANSNMGIPVMQHDKAKEMGKKIVQWRSNRLDLEILVTQEYRDFLEQSTVISSNFAEFKKHVSNLLIPEPVHTDNEYSEVNGSVVFVNAGYEDRRLIEGVTEKLSKKGFFCYSSQDLSDDESQLADRKYLEKSLLDCDIAITLYENSPADQIRHLLIQAWKINARRETPLKSTLLISDKNGNSSLNVKVPGLVRLCCCESGFEDCIDVFVREVGQ